MKNTSSGVTLLELILVIAMLTILIFSIYSIYNIALASWEIGLTKEELLPQARVGIERIVRDLQSAGEIKVYPYHIEFKKDGKDYIYYLYNPDDPWPHPPLSKEIYELKLQKIDNSFEYGKGKVIINNINLLQFNKSGEDIYVITIYIYVKKANEEVKLFTVVHPRNG